MLHDLTLPVTSFLTGLTVYSCLLFGSSSLMYLSRTVLWPSRPLRGKPTLPVCATVLAILLSSLSTVELEDVQARASPALTRRVLVRKPWRLGRSITWRGREKVGSLARRSRTASPPGLRFASSLRSGPTGRSLRREMASPSPLSFRTSREVAVDPPLRNSGEASFGGVQM